MTNYTGTYVPYCPDDPSFRLWGAAFTDALDALATAGDIVLVSPAINWASITYPVPASTLVAYAVYRFADTEQATAPVFFEIAFYSAAAGGTPRYPYIGVTVGVAYSGSGRLTSVGTFNPMYSTSVASPTATARELNIASDGSGLVMSIGMNGAGGSSSTNLASAGVFTIDRFRNPNGTPRTDGWAAIGSSIAAAPNGSVAVMVDPVSETGQTLSGGWPAVGMYGIGSTTPGLNNDAQTTLFPTWSGNRFGSYPLKMVLSYVAIDFASTPGTILPTFLGTARIYKRLGSGARTGFDVTTSAGALCSIWWSD